jgi:TRAP transporter 4TM/12TM fusion protein
MLPLAVLVFMLFDGFTPMYSGIVGLALTAMLILGVGIAAAFGSMVFRIAFWIALGAATAAFFKLGIWPIIAAIALLIAVNLVRKGGRETLAVMRASLIDGAKQAVAVGIACAIVGVIIGVLTLTGAASNFAEFVLDIGSRSLFLSLFLTMIVCLILGMGIPTIPNYIITSAIAAPALLKLGVPLIVSHMFVFYFGIMADLTPPVALAAFAAASIARASPMRIGWKATHIAIAGFVIPYMAVYDPALMLQSSADGKLSALAVAYVVLKTIVAIGLWGAAAIGFLRAPLNWAERAFAFGAASLLVAAVPWTDEAGFAASVLFLAWHWLRSRGGPARVGA